jgi:hypothetical protein
MRYEKLLLGPSRIAIQLGRMPNSIEWVPDRSNDKLYTLLTAWEGLDSYGKLTNQSLQKQYKKQELFYKHKYMQKNVEKEKN